MAEDVFGIVGSVIASAYHVESVVAEGGFGVVYRAHHGSSRAPVALKLLKLPQQDAQQQTAFLQLFRSEAELLVRLSASQPTVVRALHADVLTGKDGRLVPYLALEWLEGITLEALIAERQRANLPPVALRKLVRLLTPVARALERAHYFDAPKGAIAIVHGDLKPANIFIAQVAGEEVVKVLDFGIGKLRSAAGQVAGRMSPPGSTSTALTPAYGAPEQSAPRHDGQPRPWTDVWGLALCLVEAMRGCRPIAAEPAATMSIALDPKRRPTPRTEGIEVSDAVEAVFARALALDPRARQPHVGIFWDELVAALDQPEALAKPRPKALAEELEFDPASARRSASAPTRISAPYSIPLSVSAHVTRSSRPPSASSAAALGPAGMRAVAASAPHFVPDLELAPPSAVRRPSGEQAATQRQRPAETGVLELDSASLPAALELDLDLPADEPRAQRSVSSQRLPAVQQPSAQRPSNPPLHGLPAGAPALGEARLSDPTSGIRSTRRSTPELNLEPARSLRSSRPPTSADTSAPFEASFVAKIEPRVREERSLVQRLRPAVVLLTVAILIAAFEPIYAAASGEVLSILGLRSSLFAGALLLLALVLAGRELLREQ